MWPFHTPAAISYRCFIVTKCVSPVVFEILVLKHNLWRPWAFKVTWRHSSHVHSIRHMTFPISGQLVPHLYLSPFSRYLHFPISGTTLTFWCHVTSSIVWPFDSPYPISYSSSIVTKCVSLAVFEILVLKHNWVMTLNISRSRDVTGHVCIRFAIRHFL